MNLATNKNAHVDPSEMPFCTFIEQNYNDIDVNLISRNNFNNNAYKGNFNARPYPGSTSNGDETLMAIFMEILLPTIIDSPANLRIH